MLERIFASTKLENEDRLKKQDFTQRIQMKTEKNG